VFPYNDLCFYDCRIPDFKLRPFGPEALHTFFTVWSELTTAPTFYGAQGVESFAEQFALQLLHRRGLLQDIIYVQRTLNPKRQTQGGPEFIERHVFAVHRLQGGKDASSLTPPWGDSPIRRDLMSERWKAMSRLIDALEAP
jgi:hypothetical protein